MEDEWDEYDFFDDSDDNIGEALKCMRENDGLSLKEFEVITGICYSLTSQYENRKRKVSSKHREIIISFIVCISQPNIEPLVN
ncbi:helix-turn-helix transcriptional regulator [Lysinibacillus endophyticus]|uniref:helix-turn-helix domain-containing protein n=1 Tax=Ureibacillus endophyticus TaxID=1978490 RepID=UPI003134F4C5